MAEQRRLLKTSCSFFIKEVNMNKSKFFISISTFLFIAIILSACSTQRQVDASVTAKPIDANAHTHPANECTNSITHTHPNGKRAHTHHYSCKGKGGMTKDSHTHPANKCTKSTTHAHPNGKREHAHKYVCQVNLTNPNAHTHRANSMTRSMRHVHPGGNRPHSHHYGR